MSTTGCLNERAATALLDELWRSGVRDVCISPGGRSTPLAVALARDHRLRAWVITDERASAFFAAGVAIAGNRPTAVICTSGTAAANFLPAVVEAFWSEIPLVVLTADRPPELRDCGAAQTIRQEGLFGRHAKWSTELAAPSPEAPVERHARAVACRAVGVATTAPCGPVHVNVPFREPLVAEGEWTAAIEPRANGAAYSQVFAPRLVAADAAVAGFAERAAGARGLVVAGPRLAAAAVEPIVALATSLDWPILADPLSGVRHGAHDRTRVVDAYDILLRAPDLAALAAPEVVLRLGSLPTSKPLNRFLARSEAEQYLVTTACPWPDPDFQVSHVVVGEAADFCDRARTALRTNAAAPPTWRDGWVRSSRAVRAHLDGLLSTEPGLFEGAIAPRLVDAIPDGSLLVVGNSMPVRDVDTFVAGSAKSLRLVANRGANGIDGVVSTALGMAAATAQPCYLLIGDLSLLHDVGALQIAARYPLDLCIVVANNDGGGIFSHLPQAGLGDAFEPFFGTPHGHDFAAAAKMCGLDYTLLHRFDELEAAVRPRGGVRIVEVPTRREHNVARHRHLISRALAALGEDARDVA